MGEGIWNWHQLPLSFVSQMVQIKVVRLLTDKEKAGWGGEERSQRTMCYTLVLSTSNEVWDLAV